MVVMKIQSPTSTYIIGAIIVAAVFITGCISSGSSHAAPNSDEVLYYHSDLSSAYTPVIGALANDNQLKFEINSPIYRDMNLVERSIALYVESCEGNADAFRAAILSRNFPKCNQITCDVQAASLQDKTVYIDSVCNQTVAEDEQVYRVNLKFDTSFQGDSVLRMAAFSACEEQNNSTKCGSTILLDLAKKSQ